MKGADLVAHVFAVTGGLTKRRKSLEIVDDVLGTVFFYATLDVFLADIRTIGPDLGPRSTVDMLWTMSEHIFVSTVRPDESMVGLEAIDVVKGEETAAQNCETGRGPNTIYGLSLLVGSTCSWNTLTTMIADDCFVNSYLHKYFCHLTISNVVVGVHSENDVLAVLV